MYRPLNLPGQFMVRATHFRSEIGHAVPVRYSRNQAIVQDLGVQNDPHRLVTQLGMDF